MPLRIRLKLSKGTYFRWAIAGKKRKKRRLYISIKILLILIFLKIYFWSKLEQRQRHDDISDHSSWMYFIPLFYFIWHSHWGTLGTGGTGHLLQTPNGNYRLPEMDARQRQCTQSVTVLTSMAGPVLQRYHPQWKAMAGAEDRRHACRDPASQKRLLLVCFLKCTLCTCNLLYLLCSLSPGRRKCSWQTLLIN